MRDAGIIMYHFIPQSERRNIFKSIHFSILFFVVLIIYFVFAINGISEDTVDRQQSSLELALNRGIVSCYSVEGTYPPNLDYLVNHYGLLYDKDTFFVDYQAIGSNIYPDVTIIRKKR